MFSLRVVIVILVGPIGFQLFNWNISFRTSSWVAGLIISDFDKEWSRTLFKCFLDVGIVLDKLGLIFI